MDENRKKHASPSSVSGSLHKPSRAVEYSPALLSDWRASLERGQWRREIDCNDEMLLQDLCSLLSNVLKKNRIIDASITNSLVAIMELCRNVAMHASSTTASIEIEIDYESGRLTVNVLSQGKPFSLDSELQKRSQSDEPTALHGFQNLLSRGTLEVSHESNRNRVRFGCVLERLHSPSLSACLTIALTSRSVRIDTREYEYKQWLHLLNVKAQGTLPLLADTLVQNDKDQVDAVLNGLEESWKYTLPIQIKLIWLPPEWTLHWVEMHCISSFGQFVTVLAADKRFLVRELTLVSEPPPSRSWVLEMIEEKIKEAYKHNQMLHRSRR